MTVELTGDLVSFGPFSLLSSARRLTRNGVQVELGARALDILMALVSRPNEVVSKADLLALVWPGVHVEEGSLRFHVAGLRKALGDGEDGARYIVTLPARGYCFVAPISRSKAAVPPAGPVNLGFRQANLPSHFARMVGRADDVRALTTQLMSKRFVTVVGAGGIGKTTVAVAAAHDLAETFAGAVLFVDLGMLSDPNLATTTMASMLGLSVHTADPTPNLLSYLRDKKILLILDTCEHVLDRLAALVTQIFIDAPQVHILATSREPLRVEDEHVYKLEPLACPPGELSLTAAAARTFPATQLFLERAAGGGALLEIDDSEAAIIGGICRRLDGVALAIELAARHVEAFGLQEMAALLDRSLTRLGLGPRTAPPRQRTLQATLDWSYGLLSELERVVLRRLAVFVGNFTLDAALAVAVGEKVDEAVVFSAIDGLVAKSMLATRAHGAMTRYRLLDTTRGYALDIEVDGAELDSVAARHATYYRLWLEQRGSEWPTLATGAERAPHFAAMNNVRVALEWCFGPKGDAAIGVRLAAAAAPVFLAMSLLAECHRWSERALLSLDDGTRGGPEEMHLQATMGVSLLFTQGAREAARVPLIRSLSIAEDRGDMLHQVRQLASLATLYQRKGDFNIALQYARRCAELARLTDNSSAIAMARSTLGFSHHIVGELSASRTEFEAALAHGPSSRRTSANYFGIESNILASAILARTLWQQGYPAQAVERARRTVDEALRTDHSLSISAALIGVIPVFLWTGDLMTASMHIDVVVSRAENYFFGPFLWVGRGYRSVMAIRQGDAEGGVETLKIALHNLHQAPYELFTTPFCVALAQGLATLGRLGEGEALIEETIQQVEAHGRYNAMAEVLRAKGGLLLAMNRPITDVELCFMQSLELSRRQGARAWELRTAIDLATLLAGQGHGDRARALLQPIFDQYTEGLDTADLKAAKSLLGMLS